MKTKRIELALFLSLTFAIVLSLLNYSWINIIMFANFLGLIAIWIVEIIKTKKSDLGLINSGYVEKVLGGIIILGILFNLGGLNNSSLIISIGLILVSIYLFIIGFLKLLNKKILQGLESLIVGILLLGFFMRFNHFPGAFPIMAFSACGLVILYLIMSFAFLKAFAAIKKLFGLMGMFIFLSLAIFVISILFSTMFWPASKEIFWTALICSIIAIPIFIKIATTQKDWDLILINQIHSLYNRTTILFVASLFFAVSTPKQFLRLDFGNRPDLINSYYDCRLNYDLDNISRNNACDDFHLLNDAIIFGFYPEGISTNEVEELKQIIKEKRY